MRRVSRHTVTVLLAGAAISGLLFLGAKRALLGHFFDKVEADVSVRSRLIQEQIEKSLLAARAIQQHMQVATTADAPAFHAFAAPLLGSESGLGSLAWAPLVLRRDRETFPLLLAEFPGAENLIPAGFDMAADPLGRAALERARDSAAPAVTELNLPYAGDRIDVFVVFYPVYASEAPVGTPDERRAATRGLVIAVIRPDLLITTALRPTKPIGLPFDLSDVSTASEKRLVYRWTARLQPAPSWKRLLYSPLPAFSQRLTFADREWEMQATPNPAYLDQNHPLGHWFLLVSGLVLTSFLAGAFQKGFLQRENLKRLNGELESEIEERRKAEAALKSLLAELQAALASVKTLEGILPICASCKKIRDDQGRWTQVESYVAKHSAAEFSHSFCPDCMKSLYPDIAAKHRIGSGPDEAR